MRVILVVFVLGHISSGIEQQTKPNLGWISRLVKNLENRVHWQRQIVTDNYSDENKQKANRTDIPVEEYKSLRETDLRLPHVFPLVVNQQEGSRVYPLERLFYLTFLIGYNNNIRPVSYYHQQAKYYKRVQDEISSKVPFPCNVTGGRSEVRPTRVDRVRPGDIDLVATFGDSLLIGNGLLGSNINQLVSLDDEVSMAIGGKGTWRQYLTLPNILKEFNPNLYGYAHKSSKIFAHYNKPVYNFGAPGSNIDDLSTMMKRFVKKAKRDPKVDFNNDWKLITFMIGAIDFCQDICYWKNPYDSVLHHSKMLEKALDYLLKNSPRTIVNFIPIANVADGLSHQKGNNEFCLMARTVMCPCFFSDVFKPTATKHYFIEKDIIDAQRKVANYAKYRQKEDFVVLEQPITVEPIEFTRETSSGVTTDWRSWGPDCVHFSQRGISLVTNTLWNSFMLPSNKKPKRLQQKMLEEFICPTEDNPYIPIN